MCAILDERLAARSCAASSGLRGRYMAVPPKVAKRCLSYKLSNEEVSLKKAILLEHMFSHSMYHPRFLITSVLR